MTTMTNRVPHQALLAVQVTGQLLWTYFAASYSSLVLNGHNFDFLGAVLEINKNGFLEQHCLQNVKMCKI